MPRPPTYRPVPVKKNGRTSYRLNVPKKFSKTGVRQQLFFATRDEAKAAASRLRAEVAEFGSMAKAVSASLAEQAAAAARILEPYGISLVDCAARYAEAEARRTASVPVAEAVAAFRNAKSEGWSDRQDATYRVAGDRLKARFGERLISTIEGRELQEHVESISGTASSFNNNARLVRAIWNWCARPPRTWCEVDPARHLEKKAETSGGIGVLTPKQATALMQAAARHFPDCVPPFAIALFTGMRQAEIERLTPEDITEDGITVPAIAAKTKRRRFIHMPEPLAEWLAAYPAPDFVCPPNWQRKQRAVRRLAGFAVWSDLVCNIDPDATDAPPPGLPKWPENALRHTAATVALAHGKPLEQLVFEHGHTGGLEMLRRHYIGAMTKADAIAIWKIRPEGKKARAIRTA